MNGLQWYAYRHVNGGIHVKRFWGDYGDVTEAQESDFVSKVTNVFRAEDRETAIAKAAKLLGGVQ